MTSTNSRCPGCGSEIAVGALPYRGYYHASAECWAQYTQVLAAEYQDAVLFGQVHQLSVDAYAVQHAGGQHPDKSVCIHLVGLHLLLERDFKPFQVPARLQALAAEIKEWPHFAQPGRRALLTAKHVAEAASTREHAMRVRDWADQVWNTWEPHHAEVAALAERCFAVEARAGR
ncbi:MAG: hypothetical protein IPK67_15775 [Planctomycetes bacterium]|nr:hypothetical protein [Planctomycetota bacterium]